MAKNSIDEVKLIPNKVPASTCPKYRASYGIGSFCWVLYAQTVCLYYTAHRHVFIRSSTGFPFNYDLCLRKFSTNCVAWKINEAEERRYLIGNEFDFVDAIFCHNKFWRLGS